jgi:hypothetical protein
MGLSSIFRELRGKLRKDYKRFATCQAGYTIFGILWKNLEGKAMISLMSASGSQNVSVTISAEAKAAIDEFCDANGVERKFVMSKLYLWFVDQDDVVRKAIIGQLPKGMEVDIARTVLERIVGHEPLPRIAAKHPPDLAGKRPPPKGGG